MTTEEAKEGSFLVNKELFSLNPSALVTMFEIDVSDIVFETAVLNDSNLTILDTVFRFHNVKSYLNSTLYWQGQPYVGAPVNTEGFDINSQGTLPVPKLSICVNDDGILALTVLKERIFQLGDLTGGKVTRIRTFAKYIDAENYRFATTPEGFSPNPKVELPRDVYYIDRKSNENKYVLEYELSSIFDVEGVQLPNRIVLAQRCPFQYRGGRL
jgi:lambda family phage minor tail protein L